MILESQKFTDDDILKREDLLEIYRTAEGKRELFRMIIDGKLFDVIKTDTELAVHNYVIMRFMEIGLLDEDKIKDALKYLVDMPAVLNVDRKQEKIDEHIEEYFRGKNPSDFI